MRMPDRAVWACLEIFTSLSDRARYPFVVSTCTIICFVSETVNGNVATMPSGSPFAMGHASLYAWASFL